MADPGAAELDTKLMGRPLLLDLYCGAGGAAMGYWRAGFDIVGVDIVNQPNYPFPFFRGDALEYLRSPFSVTADAIHASPPCHDHSCQAGRWGLDGTGHLLADTRVALAATTVPWVIENVVGAEMRADYKLCGCMFGLPGLRRKRLFETSWHANEVPPRCVHTDATVTVAGHPGGSSKRDGQRGFGDTAAWKRAMGIDWMTAKELAQAIPPAYTEHIGAQLIDVVEMNAEVAS